jgi:hypothetical protein
MVTTILDRFILKRVIKKIFFSITQSRLEFKKLRLVLEGILALQKSDPKSVQKWPFEYRTVRYSYHYCIQMFTIIYKNINKRKQMSQDNIL